MKQFLYTLLMMLLALPGMADEAEVTDAPTITVTEYGPGYIITVTGDGLLNVQVVSSPELDTGGQMGFYGVLDEAQVRDTYTYEVARNTIENFRCQVIATAQADGKLVSEQVAYDFIVVKFTDLPAPYITFDETDDGVEINVFGKGRIICNVIINGVETQSVELPFFVERQDTDLFIEVSATVDGNGLDQMPSGSYETYLLSARQLEVELPEFIVEAFADYVLISAISQQGYNVHLECSWPEDGEWFETENPVSIQRTEDTQLVYVRAYCESDGAQISDWACWSYWIPAMARTAPPILQYTTLSDGSQLVEIDPDEYGCVLYYRMGIYESGGYTFMDWEEYNDFLVYTEIGHYRIEAYALVEGKNPSIIVACEFTVDSYTPPSIYDFEEDGVFYKITANNEVSVCSETWGWNSYSGEVTIPATVTHDGVTYMVTGIADNAFNACTDLTGVNIGAYVTDIGNSAFYNCTSLTSVTLGDYVINVGKNAFAGCSALETVKLGSGLAHIGAQAFQACRALTSVICKAATPPVMESSDCFECYGTATLHVYPPVLKRYQAANYWSQFATIVAEDNVASVAGDTNGDGNLTISDVTALINMLLQGK